MADAEDIQPLVCDNGTGMVKVYQFLWDHRFFFLTHVINVKYLPILLMINLRSKFRLSTPKIFS